MMDAKTLLDSLMGPSRDKAAKDQKDDGWKDRNVCKRFLVGFCPNNHLDNWFHNTRRDVGVCHKVHSERLKEDYLGHDQREKYRPEYETEFLKYLESINAEADAWIGRERGNCAAAGTKAKLSDDQKQALTRLQEVADNHLKNAEDLAEKGDITGSKEATEAAKKLNQDAADIKENGSFVPKGDTVCEICGIRYNLDDIPNYNAHKNSNLHTAYMKTRGKAQELRDKLRKSGVPDVEDLPEGVERIKKDKGHPADKGRDSSRDRDRDRDRDRRSRRDDDRGDRGRDRRDNKERSRSRGGGGDRRRRH